MYYNLIQKGYEGYRHMALNDLKNARLLSRALERSTYYEVVSTCHLPVSGEKPKKGAGAIDDAELYTPSLPVVAFKFTKEFVKEYPSIAQAKIQTYLRAKVTLRCHPGTPDLLTRAYTAMDRTQLRVAAQRPRPTSSSCCRPRTVH